MDADGKFYICLWSLVAAITIAVIIAITSYNMNQINQAKAALDKGIPPKLVACIFGGTERYCEFVVSQEKYHE